MCEGRNEWQQETGEEEGQEQMGRKMEERETCRKVKTGIQKLVEVKGYKCR